MTRVRAEACSACPYRRDAPPGLWHEDEYAKLVDYDNDTWAQPTAAFACHATPDHYCHGWAVVGGYDLLALRLAACNEPIVIPEPSTPLFDSGTDAATHGRSGLDRPPPEAIAAGDRLMRKYERLREGNS